MALIILVVARLRSVGSDQLLVGLGHGSVLDGDHLDASASARSGLFPEFLGLVESGLFVLG